MGEVPEAMKRIIQIQKVGNVAFPDQMTDAEVRQAADRLHAQARQQQPPSLKHWEPDEDDPVVRVQTSDGRHWHVHLEDLPKLKQRDPELKVMQES
jgi:hypothetical protein